MVHWAYTKHPDRRDTRIYHNIHIDCGLGYEHTPVWDDSLDFCFPVNSLKTARVVLIKRFEDDDNDLELLLWSPNSRTRFPFFPGRRSPGNLYTPPHPFCDGHLGPFDSTRSPQYFDVSRPFLPFVRRCENGSFPDDEEECVPAWAVWESSKERGSEKGYVLRAYWNALKDRLHQLRREGMKLVKDPSCRFWRGFVESYPTHPLDSDLERERESCYFQDFVCWLAALQRDLRWLAAWVRMGRALVSRRFNPNLQLTQAALEKGQDDLLGVWANGIPESMAAWFADSGVPLFIVHEIQGHKDRPDNYKSLKKVDHPLKGSDLVDAPVLEKWLSLSDGKLVAGYWKTGVDSAAAMTTDKLSRWRSSPKASPFNFPGDSWNADSSALPPTHDPIPNASFVELPDAVMEWKGLSMGSAHGATYLIPPPVRDKPKGKWEHFVEDRTDDGVSAFYLVGRKNQGVCSDMNFLFYDRALRRILHCEGPLPIPKVVVHDTFIYGFPCPKVHFFQDNTLSKKLIASFWLYPTMDVSTADIGRSAPIPSLERVSRLLPQNNDPQRPTQAWSEDPAPVTVPIPPWEQETPAAKANAVAAISPPLAIPSALFVSPVAAVSSSSEQDDTTATATVPLSTTPMGVVAEPPPPVHVVPTCTSTLPPVASTLTEEPDEVLDFELTDDECFADPEPQPEKFDLAEGETVDDSTSLGGPGLETSEAEVALVSTSSSSTTLSLSLENLTESMSNSSNPRKHLLGDCVENSTSGKRRRFTIKPTQRAPAFRLTPSRIPNARPLYSQVTPYLLVNGIGRHSMEDLRAWLSMSVPTLRVTVVIKIMAAVGEGLFVVKFYDKEEAISFKCCYNLWISEEGDTWAIEHVSHQDVLNIPPSRIVEEWRIRPGGHLHPSLDLEDPPESSLIQRMRAPLRDRLRDSTDPRPSLTLPPKSGSARKRRGGRLRRESQQLEGKPS